MFSLQRLINKYLTINSSIFILESSMQPRVIIFSLQNLNKDELCHLSAIKSNLCVIV